MSYILIYKDRSGGSILLARFAVYWLHFTCVFPGLTQAFLEEADFEEKMLLGVGVTLRRRKELLSILGKG